MRKMGDIKIALLIGGFHIVAHFVGAIFYEDPVENFLIFVTPALVIGYLLFKRTKLYKKLS